MAKAHIIDGKQLADTLLEKTKSDLKTLAGQRMPGLATVLVGNDKASALYVSMKRKKAEEVGIKSLHHDIDASISQNELLKLIHALNNDAAVDGILVQMPLPSHINEKVIIEAVNPKKDVDGFHPMNLGLLLCGNPGFVACTPLGVMHILQSIDVKLSGKHAAVIGRSNIVGKPMAHLLLQSDATVTICHSKTKDLAEITKHADIVVAAAGKAKMINRSHIKKGAVVVDVGINRDENNKLCGDVDFDDVLQIASFITPVPGGVGPLTIAMLLRNTVTSFTRSLS